MKGNDKVIEKLNARLADDSADSINRKLTEIHSYIIA